MSSFSLAAAIAVRSRRPGQLPRRLERWQLWRLSFAVRSALARRWASWSWRASWPCRCRASRTRPGAASASAPRNPSLYSAALGSQTRARPSSTAISVRAPRRRLPASRRALSTAPSTPTTRWRARPSPTRPLRTTARQVARPPRPTAGRPTLAGRRSSAACTTRRRRSRLRAPSPLTVRTIPTRSSSSKRARRSSPPPTARSRYATAHRRATCSGRSAVRQPSASARAWSAR